MILGRFIIPFMEEGFNISGLDASEYMLHKLKNKAAFKKLHPHVWQGFAEDLNSNVENNCIREARKWLTLPK